MALNVKMALIVSMVYIAGMTWILDRVASPIADLPSPLLARAEVPRSEWLYASDSSRDPQPATALVAASPVAAAFENVGHTRQTSRQEANVVLAVREDLPEPSADSDQQVILAANSAKLREPANQLAMLEASHRGEAVQVNVAVDERIVHVVVSGDSLARIARQHWGVDGADAINRIVSANPSLKGRRHHIAVGEEIVIPVAMPTPRQIPFPVVRQVGGDAVAAAASGSRVSESLQWYTIRSRDSLSSIARRLLNDERRWVEIKRINGIEDEHRIQPGMRIKIPTLASSGV